MPFLKPTYSIDGDITDIDLEQLKIDGLKAIILDLDSTLIAPRSGRLTEAAASWLAVARQNFKVAVVSNNKRKQYINEVSQLLALPVVGHAAKPSCKALFKALQMIDAKPEESLLIGDRPLTDVLGGKRAGMKTMLVYPLKSMNEPAWIKFIRDLERLVIRK